MNEYFFPGKHYSFLIEHTEATARLVILKDNVEYVCRKEKISALHKFLQLPTAHIFKGRLQLAKNEDEITVIAKGERIGTIDKKEFGKLLTSAFSRTPVIAVKG